MNIYIKLITIINLLLSLNFFELVNFSYEISDLIFANCILMPFVFLRSFFKFIKSNKFLFFFFIYLFLINIFSSVYNYNQPFFESLISGRFLIVYLLIAFNCFLYTKRNVKIDFFPFFISLIIIFLNLYVYIFNDFSFVREGVHISTRFQEVRFLLCGGLVIYLVMYSFNRINRNSIYTVLFFLLLFIIIFISKTRGIIFPMLITVIVGMSINRYIRTKKIFFLILTFFVILPFLYNLGYFSFFDKQISSILSDVSSNKNNNILFRFDALRYYINYLQLDLLVLLFGSGIPTEFTLDIHETFSLSDIGFFHFIFNHGLIGAGLFIYILINPLLKINSSNMDNKILINDYKLLLLFQFFTFLSITFFYNISSIIYFFLLYFTLKEYNDEN